MKILSKRSGTGRNTLVPSLIGLLLLLLLFLRGQSTSAASKIKSILTNAGYSDRMSTWWVAVSNLETAKWTSPLFVKYNNAFGMKQPLTRFTLSMGASPTGYATFASLDDSVNDLIAYMNVRLYPHDFDSVDDMVNFMKSKGYFEDPDYLRKVKTRL